MPPYVFISGECPVRIWGLTPSQRVERVLPAAGACRTLSALGDLQAGDTVLILRGDYLFDDRLVVYLAETPGIVLQLDGDREKVAVAAHVPARLAQQAVAAISENAADEFPDEIRPQTLDALSISFQERIRKFEPPFVLPVFAGNQRDLERRLFDWSYKGVTDLVTKWVWPVPARWVVGQCVRWGIRPNHVTFLSLLLVILAGLLFARGHYGGGLLAGWLMTFLDTVDGKLARVTVTSSRFGHYFDHVIDLVHPPIWYILWGFGLLGSYPGGLGFSMTAICWGIMIGYVAGRLAEGLFKWCLGRFGIFCWRPLDSYFRLITARRNPNLILLTAGFAAGRPDLGLLAVVFWTLSTSLLLCLRLVWAATVRIRQGPLRSWLMDVNPVSDGYSLAVRWFTRHANGR